MLLTITTTHQPATDLGYLLHKHPARAQSFDLSFGKAHVFYPEAAQTRCTAALLLDIDLIAQKRRKSSFALEQYVNDRPYVASSFMSVAIARVYGTALKGQCNERPDLVRQNMPLQAHISALPCNDDLLHGLFEPLGYSISAQAHPLDETFPEWGDSPYRTVTLTAQTRLKDLLTHLYVLIPVLDNNKHYYVSQTEIEKLLHHGEGWLADHPQRELIVDRYLKHQYTLKNEALNRLLDAPPSQQPARNAEEALEAPISLNQQRLTAVVSALEASNAQRVLDLGCGEGRLIQRLLKNTQFTEIVGLDVSHQTLERAAQKCDRLPPNQRKRLQLIQGSLVYRDDRLSGYDAAALVEVIEHIDPGRLPTFERVLFECARPHTVIITTPNADYNAHWESLPAGQYRHPDHRFEWTRAQFQAWVNRIADRFAYRAQCLPVGPEDPDLGAPTQMAVFTAADF